MKNIQKVSGIVKQVVINGGETHGSLLTPKWIVEYYKRKGIDLYVYVGELSDEDGIVYKLKESKELNDNKEIYYAFYLTENVGTVIEEFNDELESKMIYEFDMFEDREDKILIDIAKEINNEKLIKIVEIPDDVEYDVIQYECGFSEYIAEKHRTWC